MCGNDVSCFWTILSQCELYESWHCHVAIGEKEIHWRNNLVGGQQWTAWLKHGHHLDLTKQIGVELLQVVRSKFSSYYVAKKESWRPEHPEWPVCSSNTFLLLFFFFLYTFYITTLYLFNNNNGDNNTGIYLRISVCILSPDDIHVDNNSTAVAWRQQWYINWILPHIHLFLLPSVFFIYKLIFKGAL